MVDSRLEALAGNDESSVAPGSLEIEGGASREPMVYMTERSTQHNATNSTLLPSCGPYVRLDTSLELLLDRFPADNTPRVLATAVATFGSTYCKPGARMLIMRDGGYFGLLSGGCLESDLKVHAQQVLDTGAARAIDYDMRGPDDILFGIGAGCEGAMRILLEPAGPGSRAAAALAAAGRITRSGLPATLVAVHEFSGLSLGTYSAAPPLAPLLIATAERSLAVAASREFNTEVGGWRARAFIQFLAPPPHVLICGAGPDVQPVVTFARSLGWRVTVVDHRPAYAIEGRFPGADVRLAQARSLRSVVDVEHCHAAIVMSHHLASDLVYLRELAGARAPAYVGLLGPKARRDRLAKGLGATADKLQYRLHGPVGLNLGAVTPEGIALAIISEIHAWLAGRPGAGRASHDIGIEPNPNGGCSTTG
jgi:xanthine dehydrogenase accessory factor